MPRASAELSDPKGALRMLLSGGDRRSLAGAAKALSLVLRHPESLADLAGLTAGDDPLIAFRAMDVIEKVAHRDPARVEPFKSVLIGTANDSPMWEMHLQIVRALPLFRWSDDEMERVLHLLRRHLHSPNTMVRVWALDSLSIFSLSAAGLRPEVAKHLAEFETGTPAMRSRGRHIRARLGL